MRPCGNYNLLLGKAPLTCEIEKSLAELFLIFIFSPRYSSTSCRSVNINYTFFINLLEHKISSLEGIFLFSFLFFSYEGRRFNEVFIKIWSGKISRKWWANSKVSVFLFLQNSPHFSTSMMLVTTHRETSHEAVK